MAYETCPVSQAVSQLYPLPLHNLLFVYHASATIVTANAPLVHTLTIANTAEHGGAPARVVGDTMLLRPSGVTAAFSELGGITVAIAVVELVAPIGCVELALAVRLVRSLVRNSTRHAMQMESVGGYVGGLGIYDGGLFV